MTKTTRRLAGAAFAAFAALAPLLASCNQDALFADISNEPEPRDPRIEGTPLDPVVVENSGGEGVLFTGSRNDSRILAYREGLWAELPAQPGGALHGLAASEEGSAKYLYALVDKDVIKRIDLAGAELKDWETNSGWKTDQWTGTTDPLQWEDVSIGEASGYWLQTIYSAGPDDGQQVFVGAQLQEKYSIFYVDSPPALKLLKDDVQLLRGAAYDSSVYYLGTSGSGIWEGTTAGLVQSVDTADYSIMAMLKVGSKIAALTRGGSVLAKDPASGGNFTSVCTMSGYYGAGGFAVWQQFDASTQNLLLVGILGSDTATTHGYREVTLAADGQLPDSPSVNAPGGTTPTTVSNQAKYDAGMGTHPALSLIQVPESVEAAISLQPTPKEPVIFAGTPKNGLWSYRAGEWNAED
ncbi:MAG: hypothetical protein LBR16_02935 [Treponema sp.]|jgi:hypothetical protein|nr:hypothetical protein [Treponema sp.]